MNDEIHLSDVYQASQEYIRELQQLREAYDQYIDSEITPLFTRDDRLQRRPPRRFRESSFLYIRSFETDNGSRPFSNRAFWLSPDLQVSPISNLAAYTRTLNAGETYNLRCHVRNRGDRVVPSAKVEFWLADPSLGFDTRFARHLTLGQVPSTWVNPSTTGVVDFTYPVPPAEAGHKCLVARVFSFSPLELPLEDTGLDPTVDRRIGQLNLNILSQGEPFHFNWIHPPNAQQRIEIVPLDGHQLLTLRHPILSEFSPAMQFAQEELVHRASLELSATGAETIDLNLEQNGLAVMSRGSNGPDLMELRATRWQVREALKAISTGNMNSNHYSQLFVRWRQLNSQAVLTNFKMRTPDLGLGQGQVAAIHIQAVEMDNSRETQGGLTLLITGEG